MHIWKPFSTISPKKPVFWTRLMLASEPPNPLPVLQAQARSQQLQNQQQAVAKPRPVWLYHHVQGAGVDQNRVNIQWMQFLVRTSLNWLITNKVRKFVTCVCRNVQTKYCNKIDMLVIWPVYVAEIRHQLWRSWLIDSLSQAWNWQIDSVDDRKPDQKATYESFVFFSGTSVF